MATIETFVDAIASIVIDLKPEDFKSLGDVLTLDDAILLKLDFGKLSSQLAELLGQSKLRVFYEGYEPTSVDSAFHLVTPLWHLIPAACQLLSDGKIEFNCQFLVDRLEMMKKCIDSSKVDFEISLRILNIDIDQAFELAPGIRFEKLTPEEIEFKFPINRQFTAIHPLCEEHNHKHCVEVVIQKTGTMADLQDWNSVEKTGALENSIIHPFLVADIPKKTIPNISHLRIDSVFEGSNSDRGITRFSLEPAFLTAEDVETLQKTYDMLKNAEKDNVLRTAIDRYILGRKRGNHHPNRINEPNWDKIVDYVIAMETLFLTANGDALAQELSYRFRLNGSSLISRCTQVHVKTVFDALKHLYEMRSKVVHGCDDASILKAANKFIAALDIDSSNHKHSLGRLLIILQCVEKWLGDTIFHIAKIPQSSRPYRKANGWEEYLWGSTT